MPTSNRCWKKNSGVQRARTCIVQHSRSSFRCSTICAIPPIRSTGFNLAKCSQWINVTLGCALHVSYYFYLKLYCRYLYTRPCTCMINHIWGLKQLWLQVNGHAWFHLQRLRWPVRNGEGAKNSKWKYMSPVGFEPTPRQSTTGKLQRLRPLGHKGLMVISG